MTKTTAFAAYVVANMAVLPLIAHMLPRLTSAGLYFAVTVEPGFSGTAPAARILHRFRALIWTSFLLVAALAVAAVFTGRPWALVAGLVVEVAGTLASFAWAHRQTAPFAVPESSIREAVLVPREDADMGSWVHAGPFVLLGAAAAYVRACWEEIPARFPIHWDLDGRPNGWARRTVEGVYGPVIEGALVCAVLAVLAYAIRRWSRDPSARLRRMTLHLLVAAEYLVAASASLGAVLSIAAFPAATVFLAVSLPPLVVAAVLVHAVRTVRDVRRAEPAIAGDTMPDRCWKWGLFYVNASDPAVLVPKRFGIGYTLNFARPAAWALLVVILALVLLPLFLPRSTH